MHIGGSIDRPSITLRQEIDLPDTELSDGVCNPARDVVIQCPHCRVGHIPAACPRPAARFRVAFKFDGPVVVRSRDLVDIGDPTNTWDICIAAYHDSHFAPEEWYDGISPDLGPVPFSDNLDAAAQVCAAPAPCVRGLRLTQRARCRCRRPPPPRTNPSPASSAAASRPTAARLKPLPQPR